MTKKKRMAGKLTAPTKKAGRFANLLAHSGRHPKDAQSATHLNHSKWDAYK